MKVRIRGDSVEIEGYVNAVERDSKTLYDRLIGRFIERICKGAFKKAITRNDDIHILLNHNWGRDLGSTKQGNLELTEDNIGLHARACITDADVVKKARNGDLVGWSFGFEDVPGGVEKRDIDGVQHRFIRDLDLYEVSILDRSKSPAYEGTLIAARADEEMMKISDPMISENVEVTEETVETREEETRDDEQEESMLIDYTEFEEMINEMKEEKTDV